MDGWCKVVSKKSNFFLLFAEIFSKVAEIVKYLRFISPAFLF